MSNYPTQPGLTQTYHYQPPPTNALGIAGFVISLSGMVVCLGLTCPIGLILSLIALAKSPRGFAIAGSVVGVLGSILGVLTVLVATGIINSIGLFGSPYYYMTSNTLDNASYDIDNQFLNNQDVLPDEPTGNALISSYTDEWGNPLKYLPTSGATNDYTITSAGPDGVMNTGDDIVQYYYAQTQTEIAMDEASWEIDEYMYDHTSLPNANKGTSLINSYQDSWGNSLQYELVAGSAQDYNLISAGPDGQFATADDISQQYSSYGSSYGAQQVDPADLEQDQVDVAFELAANEIVGAFPFDAPLPTEKQVAEKTGEMLDAWLTPFKYSPTENPPWYHLKSAGPDQKWDTGDDITRSFYFAPTGETDGPL